MARMKRDAGERDLPLKAGRAARLGYGAARGARASGTERPTRGCDSDNQAPVIAARMDRAIADRGDES